MAIYIPVPQRYGKVSKEVIQDDLTHIEREQQAWEAAEGLRKQEEEREQPEHRNNILTHWKLVVLETTMLTNHFKPHKGTSVSSILNDSSIYQFLSPAQIPLSISSSFYSNTTVTMFLIDSLDCGWGIHSQKALNILILASAIHEFHFWSTQSGFEKLVYSIIMKSIQTLWYAIASKIPSQYIHHTREAGLRLTVRLEYLNTLEE